MSDTRPGQIIHGDCLDVMRGMEAASVDLIVTDPPYQLSSITRRRTDPVAVKGNNDGGNPYCRPQAKRGFMGKEWDMLPAVEIWREALRVLKPGAFAFVMCTSRQDSLARMIVNLEDAGFNIGQSSIYWAYATGFPKCHNVGKAIDARFKAKRQVVGRKADPRFQYAFPESSCPYQGTTNHDWSEDTKSANMANLTAPATPEAAQFENCMPASAFKPAVEVSIVCQKPLCEKSYVDQALASLEDDHVAPGCLNMGAARIPITDLENEPGYRPNAARYVTMKGETSIFGFGAVAQDDGYHNSQGRFPANLIVSDDVLNDGRVMKSGWTDADNEKSESIFLLGTGKSNSAHHGDSGSFSRYFSLDQWFAKRLAELPEGVQRTFPFLITPKPSKREKNEGCEGLAEKSPKGRSALGFGLGVRTWIDRKDGKGRVLVNARMQPRSNNHPTCKPIKLMFWLITLGSREGDLVLDPFLGSGTTGVAAKMLGREFIGIEREAEYVAIANCRLRIGDCGLKAEPQRHKDTKQEDLVPLCLRGETSLNLELNFGEPA